MAENINFIAAKDLPISEAAEVDVLCVDNGELKLKSGANLGGSNGGYVIRVPESDLEGVDMSTTESPIMINVTESYDNFADILYNGGSVWANLPLEGEFGLMYFSASGWAYMEGQGLFVICETPSFMGSMAFNLVFVNGTWTPPTE